MGATNKDFTKFLIEEENRQANKDWYETQTQLKDREDIETDLWIKINSIINSLQNSANTDYYDPKEATDLIMAEVKRVAIWL